MIIEYLCQNKVNIIPAVIPFNIRTASWWVFISSRIDDYVVVKELNLHHLVPVKLGWVLSPCLVDMAADCRDELFFISAKPSTRSRCGSARVVEG